VHTAFFLKEGELVLFGLTKSQYHLIHLVMAAIILITSGLVIWPGIKAFTVPTIALTTLQVIFSLPMFLCFIKRNWLDKTENDQPATDLGGDV
jgi:membrane protein implicated in regulation of membrane protease activity